MNSKASSDSRGVSGFFCRCIEPYLSQGCLPLLQQWFDHCAGMASLYLMKPSWFSTPLVLPSTPYRYCFLIPQSKTKRVGPRDTGTCSYSNFRGIWNAVAEERAAYEWNNVVMWSMHGMSTKYHSTFLKSTEKWKSSRSSLSNFGIGEINRLYTFPASHNTVMEKLKWKQLKILISGSYSYFLLHWFFKIFFFLSH